MATIPLPVIHNVFRCAFVWGSSVLPGTPVNVMHFLDTSGSTHVASDLAAVLNGAVIKNMWYPVASTSSITSLQIIKLDGTSATGSFATSGANWVGSGAGQPVAQVAVLVKLQTGLRGRNHRGRVYLPHISENDVNYGSITGVPQSTTQSAWNSFITALSAATIPFDLGVASYDRAHLGAGATFTPIQSLLVESYTATQRRRQPGRKVSRH